MKLKYDFILNEVADNVVAVAVGDDMAEFNGFVKLNDVGAAIFKCLQQDTTAEDICAKIKTEFSDATDEEIAEAVNQTLENLKNSDLIIDG